MEVLPPRHMAEKSVLVCVGERKRAVSFSSPTGGGEKMRLLAAANQVFGDITHFEDDAVVQVKSEAWGGEFVDVTDVIPDMAIVRILEDVSFLKMLLVFPSLRASNLTTAWVTIMDIRHY